ncbi:hypothetical protein [Burkholderia cenocepacia]|uniref:hypothetical protein n=1 Tax=Burkholderia cenocepacia TaxID=95486 RepID=UPI00190685D3|nr:hypothetical protein [Burkholderia cenocepacia]MBJ9895247.1 hypothetical protein [Burkholderia cenocepacia]MBJ9917649.1 hypothetical protein [Burkholderia cenocepacia]
MSEVNGQAWGMCAAFGCPLFGTVGSDGRWYCYCHAGRPSATNDAITQMLHAHEPIVKATISIRRNFASFRDNPNAYRAIQRGLVDHSRSDLLLGKADESPHAPGKPVVKLWLARLERELISLTADLGQQRLDTGIVPTAPIIGPTHALQHYTERGEG